MKRYFLLIFCCLSFAASLWAEREIRVYGYVYTPEREEAAGVLVQAVGTNTAATTQSDGYYEIRFKATDDSLATLRYTYAGCDTVNFRVESKQNNIRKIVYLRYKTLYTQEAIVYGNAAQTGQMTTLNTEHLRLIPSASGDAISSMLAFHGASSTNEMSSQYSVRGGSYDENSVYVNNIEIYRPLLIRSGQQEGLSFINADMVSAVRFSAGGFDAEYGDKMSSVLDITYKKPTGFEASVSGSLLGASAYVGHATKNNRFTQIHGFRYKTANYLFTKLDTKGIYDQRFLDYQTYLTYVISPKWEIDFLGNFSQNSYLSIPDSLTTTFGTQTMQHTFKVAFDGQEKDLFRTLFGAVTLKYAPTKNFSFSLLTSAFSTQEKMTYDIASEYWLSEGFLDGNGVSSNETVLGVGADLEYARNQLAADVENITLRGEYRSGKNLARGSNLLKWGIGIQREAITDKISEFQLRDSTGYSLPHQAEEMAVYYNLFSDTRLETFRTQAFVQDIYRLSAAAGTWWFTGGVRANYWSFNREWLISPRLTVTFSPKRLRNFNFRFSSGVYYQAPFYKEIKQVLTDEMHNSYVHLNRDIKAQRSLHVLLGSDYFFKIYDRPFKLTSEIFYKPADRVTTYTVDNVQIIYSGLNNAKAYSAGIDLKLFGELVPGADSWISLTLMQSKEDVEGDGVGYVSRPNEQSYNLSIFFQDYVPLLPKFKVHLKLIFSDGLPFWAPNLAEQNIPHTPKNTNPTRDYFRVDIGASRSFVKGDMRWLDKTQIFRALKSINIGVECLNLFDMRNVASHYWITDVQGNQHAVPNFLTRRQFNVRLSLDF